MPRKKSQSEYALHSVTRQLAKPIGSVTERSHAQPVVLVANQRSVCSTSAKATIIHRFPSHTKFGNCGTRIRGFERGYSKPTYQPPTMRESTMGPESGFQGPHHLGLQLADNVVSRRRTVTTTFISALQPWLLSLMKFVHLHCLYTSISEANTAHSSRSSGLWGRELIPLLTQCHPCPRREPCTMGRRHILSRSWLATLRLLSCLLSSHKTKTSSSRAWIFSKREHRPVRSHNC